MDIDEYQDLVLDIYQTVSDPSHWPRVLDRICHKVRARGCIVFEWQKSKAAHKLTAPLFSTSYDPVVLNDYIERNTILEIKDQGIFKKHLIELDGINILHEDILYNSKDEYTKRENVKELNEYYNIRYRTGSLLDKDNTDRSRFTLQFSKEHGPLDDERYKHLDRLLPHVAKALDVGRPIPKTSFENEGFLAIISQLNVGVCLLDQFGRVIIKNAEFERQAAEYQAFFTDRTDKLRLHANADHKQFARLLSGGHNHGQYGARPRKEAIIVPTGDRTEALCIEVVPLNKTDDIGSRPFNGALIISRDTSKPMAINLSLVQEIYGFSDTQTSLVDLISQGLTNAEIAERRERSVETVNSQVKSILGKSRAANRTQLVRLLGNFT